jgi:hypothetical protein
MARLVDAFRWLRDRVRRLGRVGRVSDDDIQDELGFHLAMETELLERDGMSRAASATCGEAKSWKR